MKLEDDLSEVRSETRSLKAQLKSAKQQIDTANEAVGGKGLWNARPVSPPKDYPTRLTNSIPIITVANLKGGVGKTTITANLAWYFANAGKRVLLIDLDFQGSLSALTSHPDIQEQTVASDLVEGIFDISLLEQVAWPMADLQNARVLTAYYDLARSENKAMVQWLLGTEQRDIRYLLAEALLNPSLRRQPGSNTGFDLILIDAAPRLTTSTVQALAASTHLLIPTILDRLSADAVGYFVRQYFINKPIWPHLKLAGVVGSMTEYNMTQESSFDDFKDFEQMALNRMTEALKSVYLQNNLNMPQDIVLPYSCFIPDMVGISRAAEHGLAALSRNAQIRESVQGKFTSLGTEVARRVGLNA